MWKSLSDLIVPHETLNGILEIYNYWTENSAEAEALHCLPITCHIQCMGLLHVSTTSTWPPHISLTLFANLSLQHLPTCSTDRLDLFIPRVRTALAQCRAFSVIGLSTSPFLRAKLMSGISVRLLARNRAWSPLHPVALFRRFCFPRVFRAEGFSEESVLWEAV